MAAMREAEEEIGLAGSFVEIVGRLPNYLCLVGLPHYAGARRRPPGFALTPNPTEVDDVFQVPLSFLMDPANHDRDRRVQRRHRPAISTSCPMKAG